jgi:arginine decarboxylase
MVNASLQVLAGNNEGCRKMLKEEVNRWTIEDSSELYDVPRWGSGYFSVGPNGSLRVHPDRSADRAIDLEQLVKNLEMRGIDLPVLLRFTGILEDRLNEIQRTFSKVMEQYDYQGTYSCVYPIKVNQQRQVVEEIITFGRPHGFGLEAGSKPELLAVVALTDPDTPIICNGFKDGEFVEMAMLAQKMGRQVIPVVEKFTDLELILRYAERVGVRPRIGVRARLAARGSGRWHTSGGYRSKFGLSVTEILNVLATLQQRDMADCFKLLHFHLGSQITDIRNVKKALDEASRIYVDLAHRGAGLEYLDIGGGLGVDYSGTRTNEASSVNYTLEEYCSDVVHHIQTTCDDADVPHPHIISESGRAVVAYHSVLVFSVLGVIQHGRPQLTIDQLSDSAPQPICDLRDAYLDLTSKNALEAFHDAQQALETTIALFSTGHLSIDERGVAEDLYWAICRKISELIEGAEYIPEELTQLNRLLCDTYFCNMSIFQSMPDSWAINQLFPIMPIHRLEQHPTQQAVLADITCDSDGKIDQFIDRYAMKQTLPLHPYDGSPYLLGAFLVGAYQEILGDLHNLFGDTNAVHVNLTEDGNVELESIIRGDTVTEVLDYVEFHRKDLVERLQSAVEGAVRSGRLDSREAGHCMRFYEEALNGYTYLEESD